MQNANETANQVLPTRAVLKRYGVVGRTVDRWVANPELGFPRPIMINRRRYFRLAELEVWERSRALLAGRAS